ncbi:MAG: chorismate mutase [Sulfolobales archaeon]|nr:chorismate mutase [Sulfolobales archaeon]MCX8185998.1 chorismate mutase [Sulfolobales archaeon]MDW7969255.1 chorismate mutase [Sulfolobales archaeon]
MKSIEELRSEIDRIDEEIVKLVAMRVGLVKEIADVKMEKCLKLVNPSREAYVLTRVRGLSSELGINPDHVELLFRIVMMICLKEELMYVEERCGHRCCREDG